MITYSISLANFDRLTHVLDRYGAQLADLNPLFRMYEKYLATPNAIKIWVIGQQQWKKLSPNWLEYKKRHGYYHSILAMNGPMLMAFKIPGGPGNLSKKTAKEWIYGVDLDYVDFQGKSKYPALHNVGTDKLPKREWCYVTPWMMQRMKFILYRYVRSIMRGQPINLAGRI